MEKHFIAVEKYMDNLFHMLLDRHVNFMPPKSAEFKSQEQEGRENSQSSCCHQEKMKNQKVGFTCVFSFKIIHIHFHLLCFSLKYYIMNTLLYELCFYVILYVCHINLYNIHLLFTNIRLFPFSCHFHFFSSFFIFFQKSFCAQTSIFWVSTPLNLNHILP